MPKSINAALCRRLIVAMTGAPQCGQVRAWSLKAGVREHITLTPALPENFTSLLPSLVAFPNFPQLAESIRFIVLWHNRQKHKNPFCRQYSCKPSLVQKGISPHTIYRRLQISVCKPQAEVQLKERHLFV